MLNMEIYRHSVNEVRFYLPTPNTAVQSASWSGFGTTDGALAIQNGDGYAYAFLPYLSQEGTVTVTWNFSIPGSGTYSDTQSYRVVTRILPLAEVRRLLPNASDEERDEAERLVRLIIQAHCGQEFGTITEVKTVSAAGGNALKLPSRLLSIAKIDGYVPSKHTYRVSADGWSLRYPLWQGVPPLKADYHGLHEINGVIYNPNNVRWWAEESVTVSIEGVWGWPTVPPAVQEAARLLVKDYGCQDSVFRDRFVSSVNNMDWKIAFDSQAFSDTGNVKANQLLSEYIAHGGWSVV